MIRNGTELEEYVKHVYSSLLNMKDEGVIVSRRAVLRGKSGANHEVDVYYEFKRAGIRHRVAIECKHVGRPVEKGDVAEFEGKVRDIGGVTGVVISNSGYQEGAKQYASHWDIILLTTNDLPTLNVLLAARLGTVALPDENYIGEPFWTIMELRDGKVTGSHYATSFPGSDEHLIPLTFSKNHAERIFREARLDSKKWAIRGLPRFALRAFLITLELYEKKMNGGAIICFLPPGAPSDAQFVGIRASRKDLICDYYGESIPSIEDAVKR